MSKCSMQKKIESLSRKNEELSEYEQQAVDFCNKWGVTMKVGSPKYEKPLWDDKEHYIFPVTLTKDGESMRINFGQSLADGNKKPSEYDVLATICKYDIGSFEDFCSEFGYDEDSRKAERTYKACLKEWKDVERVFGGDGECLEELQEIE